MRERERGLRNLAIFLSFAHSQKVICKKSDVDGHVNSFFQISFCSNDDDEADDDDDEDDEADDEILIWKCNNNDFLHLKGCTTLCSKIIRLAPVRLNIHDLS